MLPIDARKNFKEVKKGDFRRIIAAIGLHERIFSQHPNLQPPSTRSPGKNIIDGIFGNLVLDRIRGGYGTFVGFSDYRLSWVEIN